MPWSKYLIFLQNWHYFVCITDTFYLNEGGGEKIINKKKKQTYHPSSKGDLRTKTECKSSVVFVLTCPKYQTVGTTKLQQHFWASAVEAAPFLHSKQLKTITKYDLQIILHPRPFSFPVNFQVTSCRPGRDECRTNPTHPERLVDHCELLTSACSTKCSGDSSSPILCLVLWLQQRS